MAKRPFMLLIGVLTMALIAALMLATPAVAQSEGRIAGIAYADLNGNGVRDEGEEGLQDVRLNFASGGWDTSINTAADGSFSIDLNPATWTVTVLETPDSYAKPDPASVEIVIENAGDSVTNLEFGLRAESDVLPESGSPIPGPAIVAGLIALLLGGVAMVIIGQRRSTQAV